MLIEQTAGRMAAEMYEVGRKQGMTSKHKTPRAYAKANLEKFIPIAMKFLIDMLGREDVAASQKEIIYQAILERTNDEQLNQMGQAAGLPEFEKTILYKPDNEKPKPIIVDTRKIDHGQEEI